MLQFIKFLGSMNRILQSRERGKITDTLKRGHFPSPFRGPSIIT